MTAAGFAQQTQPPATQPARKPPAAPADAAGALDSLTNSLQDLNAIRDGNLSRLQKDCSPETAARIAELRGKLRQFEAEPIDAQAIAANWFKPAPPAQQEAQSERESRLVSEVLSGNHAASAKAAPNAQRSKADEAEIARLQSEIARLAGTCTAVRK
jgi:hypothetical protein